MQKLKQIVRSVKDCKNCVYYLKQTIEEQSMCIKFLKIKNEFSKANVPKFESAKECRLDPYKCSESGSYYISNLLR